MTRSFSRVVRGQSRLPLTITTMMMLSAVAAAQLKAAGAGTKSATPGATHTVAVDLSPKNKLVFPFGVQTFEKQENVKLGNEVTVLPGWRFDNSPSQVGAIITQNENGLTRPGSTSKRWLAV